MISPIFSGGVGRSGTTLVAHLLGNHPDIFVAMPREVKFITEGFGLIDLCFGMRSFPKSQATVRGQIVSSLGKLNTRHMRLTKFRDRVLDEWWDTSSYNPGGALDVSMSKKRMLGLLDDLCDNLENPIEAARNFTFGYIQNHKEYNGQKYWIDTSLSNIMYSNFIYQIFPEAKFIEMRRHPLDNIGSVLNQDWGPQNENKSIRWWSDRIKLADASVCQIPKNMHSMFFLENLAGENKIKTYKQICDFIGIDNKDQKTLDYLNNEINYSKANIGRWHYDIKDPHAFAKTFISFVKKEKYDYKIDMYDII